MKKAAFFGLLAMVLAFGLVSCGTSGATNSDATVSSETVELTEAQQGELAQITLYTAQADEAVQTMYIDRTESLLNDLASVEGGVWYESHMETIVGIDAVIIDGADQWFVSFVD
jgi:hypothetical protein